MNHILEYGSEILAKTVYHVEQKFIKKKLNRHFEDTNISGDFYTAFDLETNNVIREMLDERRKSMPVLLISEETGIEHLGSEPAYFMLLDPVDGSNNIRPFFTPAPRVCISAGFGLISDLERLKNPNALKVSIHREFFQPGMYYAVTGAGAYYSAGNGRTFRIRTSPLRSLMQKCVVGVDLDKRNHISPGLKGLLEANIIQRRLGSSILDFCQLASGQYDAYISDSGRLKLTDVCQPYHTVKEAGGEFEYEVLLDGKPSTLIHETFLEEILRDESLLSRIKFNVVAAGNNMLMKDIKKYGGIK